MSLQSRPKSLFQRVPFLVRVCIASFLATLLIVLIVLGLKSSLSPRILEVQSIDALAVRRLMLQNDQGEIEMLLSTNADGAGMFSMYSQDEPVLLLSHIGGNPKITMSNGEGKIGLSLSVDADARGAVLVNNSNEVLCAAIAANPDDYGVLFAGKPDGEPLVAIARDHNHQADIAIFDKNGKRKNIALQSK